MIGCIERTRGGIIRYEGGVFDGPDGWTIRHYLERTRELAEILGTDVTLVVNGTPITIGPTGGDVGNP